MQHCAADFLMISAQRVVRSTYCAIIQDSDEAVDLCFTWWRNLELVMNYVFFHVMWKKMINISLKWMVPHQNSRNDPWPSPKIESASYFTKLPRLRLLRLATGALQSGHAQNLQGGELGSRGRELPLRLLCRRAAARWELVEAKLTTLQVVIQL